MEGLITYSEEFISSTGLKRWVGIKIPYDVNSQDPMEMFSKAEAKVQAFGNKQPQNVSVELPVIQVSKETAEDRRIAQFVKDIEGCKTLKTLRLFKNMIEDSMAIKNAYFKRENQLTLLNNKS
jgi:hypothetical protein